MEARALYDFNGRSSDELSFRQGDFLTVIDIVSFLKLNLHYKLFDKTNRNVITSKTTTTEQNFKEERVTSLRTMSNFW